MLSVGVLIDLHWRPQAGGLVKSWENFSKAAAVFAGEVDLTLHLLGDQERGIALAENVRYMIHPSLLSTTHFRFMDQIPEPTDLAPLNPWLFRHLSRTRHHVIHTTDAYFAFAKTALLFSRASGTPLVNSIQTDNPRYARLYSALLIRRLFKGECVRRLLMERLRFDERNLSSMRRKLERYLRRCDRVLVSNEEDFKRALGVLPPEKVSFLRMGIDKETFHPQRRDRGRLNAAFGIKPEKFLLLFVGRVDQGKSVMVLAEAARMLLDRNEPIHVMIVGEGSQREEIQKLLGSSVTCPGVVPHSILGWLYASADVFVFPSEIETFGNVVLEAKASGLPVLVSARGGVAQILQRPGRDGLLIEGNTPALWAEAIVSLRRNPALLVRLGKEARRHIEREWPSWEEVLATDLLPVWRAVMRGASIERGRPCSGKRSSFLSPIRMMRW